MPKAKRACLHLPSLLCQFALADRRWTIRPRLVYGNEGTFGDHNPQESYMTINSSVNYSKQNKTIFLQM